MTIIAAIFLILVLIYAAGLFYLRSGFHRTPAGRNRRQPQVSLVVAARNEEKNIERCLRALLRQSYPSERLQIIVVDDRSHDHTAEIVRSFAAKSPQVQLLQVQHAGGHLAPKKRALALAVEHARGDIIFTTDADCCPGPEWIATIMGHFEPGVGMVAGYNPYRTHDRDSLFRRLLALDYFAMASVAAATAAVGFPLSCSGGNLAYRRQLYHELGGFANFGAWVSGDDDLFLQKVRQQGRWQIRYVFEPAAQVTTEPPATLKAFYHQRLRYASKGRHYSGPVSAGLTGVYAINFALAGLPLFFVSTPVLLPVWLAGFAIKTLAEYLFLKTAAGFFQTRLRPGLFALAALLHPVYISVIGLLAQFKSFAWKGETFSKKMKPQQVAASADKL